MLNYYTRFNGKADLDLSVLRRTIKRDIIGMIAEWNVKEGARLPIQDVKTT